MTTDRETTISYENVSDRLAEHIPELSEAYETELKWWGGEKPGPHVVYGDILNPYLDRLLQSDSEGDLRKVFAFLELLSCSEDNRIRELVAVTVCEHLGDDGVRLRKAQSFMGPATLKLSQDVENFTPTHTDVDL